MWTRFRGWWTNWFQPDLKKEREHKLNRARHKALYSRSGRVKVKRSRAQKPLDRREQHK